MEGVVEGLVRWANRYGNYQYRVNFLECLKGLISLYRPGCEGGGLACRGERGPTGHRLRRRSLVPEFTANDAC